MSLELPGTRNIEFPPALPDQEVAAVLCGGSRRAVGVIELAVGVRVTGEFRTAVGEVSEDDGRVLKRREGEYEVDTGQQYAEVAM